MLLTPCVSISIPQMAGDGVVKWRGEDDRKVNMEHKIYINMLQLEVEASWRFDLLLSIFIRSYKQNLETFFFFLFHKDALLQIASIAIDHISESRS